jgi:hypothetical protein
MQNYQGLGSTFLPNNFAGTYDRLESQHKKLLKVPRGRSLSTLTFSPSERFPHSSSSSLSKCIRKRELFEQCVKSKKIVIFLWNIFYSGVKFHFLPNFTPE